MSEPMKTVELRAVPLSLARRAAEHTATVMRELALVDAADDTSTAHGRLLALAPELREKYARFGAAQRARAQAAALAGAQSIDLTYEVPGDLFEDARTLVGLLAEVDAFCRAGELVTLVTPSDVAAYRGWIFGEFEAQLLRGAKPTPWSDDRIAAEHSGAEAAPRTATIAFDDDLDLVGAAKVRDEITQEIERGVTDLVIDIRGCEFVDSVGISLLLTTLARLRDSGGSLRLINVHDAIKRTFHHAGILDLLVHD